MAQALDWIHGQGGTPSAVGALGALGLAGLTAVGAAFGFASPRAAPVVAPLVVAPLVPATPVAVPPVIEVASAIAMAGGFSTLATGLGVAAPLVTAGMHYMRKRKAPEESRSSSLGRMGVCRLGSTT